MKFILLALSVSVYLFGCAPHTSRSVFIKYDVPMVKVDRPADVKAIFGATQEISLADSSKYFYADSLIDALFFFEATDINFTITNKSDHTMKLIWDDAVMIEPDNTSTRVMHVGVKYTDRNNSMPPTIIPRRGKLQDQATPTSRIYWREGVYSAGSWDNSGVFPWVKHFNKDNASEIPIQEIEDFYVKAKTHVGSKVGLVLPLEIEGVKNEYTFWFEVKAATLDTSFAPTTNYY